LALRAQAARVTETLSGKEIIPCIGLIQLAKSLSLIFYFHC
jgi:hypothetical protein